jgi:hypothetical protein
MDMNELRQVFREEFKIAIKPLEDRLTGVENRLTVVENRLTVVENRLTVVENRLTGVENRLTVVENRLTGVENRLTGVEISNRIMSAKMANASAGRDEALHVVPKQDGTNLACEFPQTIGNLLVSVNEKLPNGQSNTWNKTKSLLLLREYDPAYDTDADSDTDIEGGERSKNRRLRVAKVIGITRGQLNFAQMTL